METTIKTESETQKLIGLGRKEIIKVIGELNTLSDAHIRTDRFNVYRRCEDMDEMCLAVSLVLEKSAHAELLYACDLMFRAVLKTKLPVNEMPHIAHASQFLSMALKNAYNNPSYKPPID